MKLNAIVKVGLAGFIAFSIYNSWLFQGYCKAKYFVDKNNLVCSANENIHQGLKFVGVEK